MQISLWEKESFFTHRDIIIIGAGFMGLWSAYELKKCNPNLKILILEKGIIPQGASTRNAGFACFGSPTELIHDAQFMGDDKMWQVVEMRYCGLQKIRSIFPDNVTGFEMSGGYECLNSSLHNINNISEKLKWLNNGLKSITALNNTFTREDKKLKTFGLTGFDALIENNSEGGLHTGKYISALLAKVQSMGIEILCATKVGNWEKRNHIIQVNTDNGFMLTCNKLLLCTNASTSSLIKNINVKAARGQMLLTSEIPSLQLKGTFHYDEGFYYFRNINNRILLGGARNNDLEIEQTTELRTTDIIQTALEKFLQKHILSNAEYKIEYKWSGIMGFTENKLPLIHREDDNVFAVVACNGMGVALTPVIAEKVASVLLN